MKKPVHSFVLCFTLLFVITAAAQKNTAAKPPTSKQHTAVQKQQDIPPELKKQEGTKIDVVAPPVPDLDTTAAPDDALTREIKKLLDVSNAVAIGVSTTENLLLQQKAASTDARMNAFYTTFLQTFKSKRVHGLLETIFVKAYRDAYTLEEVKQLTEFYKTPVGKKTLAVLPAIMQKSQQQCSRLGTMLAAEIYQQQNETDQ